MGDNSAFKILLSEEDMKDTKRMSRREEAKQLLSGSMKPSLQPNFPMPPQQTQQPFPPNQQQPFPSNQQPFPSNQPPFQPQQQPFAPPFHPPFSPPQPQPFQPPFQPFNHPYPPQNQFQPFSSPFSGGMRYNNSPNAPLFNQFPKPNRAYGTQHSRTPKLTRNDFSVGDHYGIEETPSKQADITQEDIRELIRNSDGPEYLKDAIERDVMKRLREMEKRGYRLPENFDKNKHDIDAAQHALFTQQAEREQQRDESRARDLINLVGVGLPRVFQWLKLDWIKTGQFEKLVKRGLDEGDFENCLGSMGRSLRNTIFDNPTFSAAFVLLDKAAQANRNEIEDENDHLFEKQQPKTSVNNLAQMTEESFVKQMSRKPLNKTRTFPKPQTKPQ